MENVKYPRTLHLPWSPGATSDDKFLKDLDCFDGKDVVVTEKMDGENTTLYRHGLHARSLDYTAHPSRNLIKQLHAQVCQDIPDGWRICGENLTAVHSVRYEELPSFFMVFSVWTGENVCLSWQETVEVAEMLGLPCVPVLWEGTFDADLIENLVVDTTVSEGYVVRNAEGFAYADFGSNVAKWVRPSHVQTDQHWMKQQVVFNGFPLDV